MAEERWRVIPSFPTYEASSEGHIRRIDTSRLMSARIDAQGYPLVTLMKANAAALPRSKQYTPVAVHRLVCEAFNGPRPSPGMHAAHENGIRVDCRAINLSWKTPVENGADQYRHGTRILGEKAPQAKLTAAQVEEMRGLRARGESWRQLSRRFGVSIRAARNVCGGKTWKHVSAVALIAATLAACSTSSSNDVPRVCPAVRTYTRAQLDKAADELDRLGAGSELSEFMADYESLRAQARDCEKK